MADVGRGASDCNAVNVAANVLTGYGNYPYLDATWFLALADVPGVSLQHITGQQTLVMNQALVSGPGARP